MFGIQTSSEMKPQAVTAATAKGAFKSFQHAAARISKDAKASIITSDEPSMVGTPPHTEAERGHNLRLAIRFAADKDGAVIGPMASIIGEAGFAHEFGAVFKGQDFAARPFMLPALTKNVDRFAQDWAGSITP